MEQVHVVRHKHFAEGQSVRQIARDMGLNRRTVRKYLRESEPRREETSVRRQPVISVVGPRIEALLDEWRPRLVGKHRLTSPRVHRELIEEGFSVGERTVRHFLAEKRRQAAEVYIPLVHRPGDEAQVDFFEVTVDEGGRRRKMLRGHVSTSDKAFMHSLTSLRRKASAARLFSNRCTAFPTALYSGKSNSAPI